MVCILEFPVLCFVKLQRTGVISTVSIWVWRSPNSTLGINTAVYGVMTSCKVVISSKCACSQNFWKAESKVVTMFCEKQQHR